MDKNYQTVDRRYYHPSTCNCQKRAETENDSLKSPEFTVAQFKKSQNAIANI